jgi:hypothetical protein
MEIRNDNFGIGLVARAVAFGLAVVTTAFIATSTAVVFTGAAAGVGTKLVAVVAAPLRSLIGI